MNCPKCDADIGDTYEPDDHSVGICQCRECAAARPSEATAGQEALIGRDLMLEYARRLNTIATECEVNGMGRDASDLYRIAEKLGRQADALALPASRNGVDTDGADVKPQGPVGHYTGRPIR